MQVFTSTNSNCSPKLCLLLKTLLFLLCIYIKRVTAAAAAASNSQCKITPIQEEYLILSDQSYDQINDNDFDLMCPIEEMVEKKKGRCDNRSSAYINELKKDILSKIKCVDLLKNNEAFFRESANDVHFHLNTSEPHVKLKNVGGTDQALYTFKVEYHNLSTEAYKYFNLYPGAQYHLYVWNAGQMLQDTRPALLDYPIDKYVHKGQDVTFKCRAGQTLTAQYTHWFKSPPNNGLNTTALDQYLSIFEKLEKGTVEQNIIQRAKYLIKGRNGPELALANVTEKDIGYYGCMVENSKGYDIRHGYLDLFESKQRKIENEQTTPESLNPVYSVIPLNVDTKGNKNMQNERSTQLNHISYSSNATIQNSISSLPATVQENKESNLLIITLVLVCILFIAILCLTGCVILKFKDQRSHLKDKNRSQSNLVVPEPIVGVISKNDNYKQHLPSGGCPDIYNTGKVSDGFISGHLMQRSTYLMAQSTCNQILDKEKNPSISSNSNSDEASSWGKSSHGDNSRAFYLHTSNTTTTTVPLYDHPPSTGAAQLCGAMVQDACVINPTYGFLRLDSSATNWLFPRRNLERLNMIGEGQFGEVWRYIARQKDGSVDLVAVKQLKERVGLGDRERLELLAEIEIMKSVNNHPNVIKLLHYCVEDYQPILLIMEYAEHGKLQTYLRNCRSRRKLYGSLVDDGNIITSKELVTFSYHVAKGMEYIAAQGIIHRDLASRNILVSRDKVCKVADFGFARRISQDCAYERTTANPVPIKWMAPEALVENKFTTKSDVYSLGVLMWEIVTLGATPYESLNSDQVVKKVNSGGRLEKPAHCRNEFYSIMEDCWRHNPTQRPTFKEVAQKLEKLVLSETDYIELDQYPEHAYYNIVTNEDKVVVQANT